jgi:hypothetical protein
VWPDRATIWGAYERATERLEGWWRDADTPRRAAPLASATLGAKYGAAGGIVAFTLTQHASFHLGQLSAVRRAMGYRRIDPDAVAPGSEA